jgi:hypothetical protein
MLTQWFTRRRRPGSVPTLVPSASPKPLRKLRPVRLLVEQLESRYCPTPVISNFQAIAEHNVSTKTVELKGSVSDTDSGSIKVSFSGCGVSASTTLPGSGNFDIFASASSLGTVTAQAQNLTTLYWGNPVTASIYDQPPVITNFTASFGAGGVCTFSGQVMDDQSVAGLTVTLGGIPSLQGVKVTTNSQGWFTYTCQLGPHDSGTATAQTQDIWGMLSNVAWTIVN